MNTTLVIIVEQWKKETFTTTYSDVTHPKMARSFSHFAAKFNYHLHLYI